MDFVECFVGQVSLVVLHRLIQRVTNGLYVCMCVFDVAPKSVVEVRVESTFESIQVEWRVLARASACTITGARDGPTYWMSKLQGVR